MTETRTFQGVTYTNGACPKSILAPLDGDNWGGETAYLRKDAAASYNRARAEVLEKTGIVLTVRGWNRTLAEQEQFFHERYVKGLSSRDQRYHVHAGVGAWYGLKAGNAAAAIPGDSNHGWAIALDVVDFGTVGNFNHPRRVATIAILKRHGWTDDEGRGPIKEPWHLVYDPARDQHRNDKPAQEAPDMDANDKAIAKETLEILRDLRDGKAPLIPVSTAKAAETITLRAALRDIRMRTGSIAALAAKTMPVTVDVDPADLADAFGELLNTLPAATAKAVLDGAAARLKS